VPEQDVHENNAQGQGPPPSVPPPLSDMDNLHGYENTQFKAGKWTVLVEQWLDKKTRVGVVLTKCTPKLSWDRVVTIHYVQEPQ